MKRILFVFLFIIESGYIFAQYSSIDGNPYEFSTLGGVQYNPGNHLQEPAGQHQPRRHPRLGQRPRFGVRILSRHKVIHGYNKSQFVIRH